MKTEITAIIRDAGEDSPAGRAGRKFLARLKDHSHKEME